MARFVRGADGRKWTIRYRMEWTSPATVDDFQHDVSGGRGQGVVMAVVIGLLVAVLVASKRDVVIVPPWLVLALLVVLLFFPARWVLRRPWAVVAETPGDLDDHPPERWVGNVRGFMAVRREATKIAREIVAYSSPGLDGVLQPVD